MRIRYRDLRLKSKVIIIESQKRSQDQQIKDFDKVFCRFDNRYKLSYIRSPINIQLISYLLIPFP